MLIKWEGGSHKSGFPTCFATAAFTTTAILVNILSVISTSLAVPSSVPPPTVLLAKSIGIPIASQDPTLDTVSSGRRVPKQVGLPAGTAASNADHQPSGTHNHGFMGDHGGHHHGHHHHHHGDGKYFMYAHNPAYDEYEYGYRRGNDYHHQERYEKYGPAWNFKTKVKWHDHYGGHGQQFWDYNHAGSGHDDGGGGGGHGHYSEPVPTYENQPGASNDQKKVAMIYKRQSNGGSTKKSKDKLKQESKRIPVRQRQAQENSPSDVVIGDNKPSESRDGPILVLDRETGQIIDTQTGKAYWLRPEHSQHY